MKTKPIPIALPHDLLQQVDEVQQLTGMSKADIMRLCMRIGLVDLRAAEHDLPGIVKRIADDAGVSFTRYAHHQSAANTLLKGGTVIPSRAEYHTTKLNESPTSYVTADLKPFTADQRLAARIAARS